ncbi:PQQ-binding-like beta-propeller repeat protein [Microbacterium sp. NPDC076895]|uniref:outer membrane protein assembly factor BamB family protein n=1 Tax=Microbacterium sp. NPDC076895 TaxID=3154957 RepID=UPI003443EA26
MDSAPTSRVRDRRQTHYARNTFFFLLAAGAIAAAAILIVPRFFASGIAVADITETPSIGVWAVDGPTVLDDGADALVERSVTTAQDRVLLAWRVRDAGGAESSWLSLVDTTTGDESWSTQVGADISGIDQITTFVGSRYAVVRASMADSISSLFLVSLSDGSAREIEWPDVLGMPETLDGDAILYDPAGTVVRYDPDDGATRWETSFVEGEQPRIVGASLLLPDRVLSLEDGLSGGWLPSPEATYFDLNGRMMSRVDVDEWSKVSLINEDDGLSAWTLEFPADVEVRGVPDLDLLLVSSAANGWTQVLRASDGNQLWTTGVIAPDPHGIFGSAAAGILLLPVGEDNANLTVFDAENGAALYDISVRAEGDTWRAPLGASSNTLYIADGGDAKLFARDATTGQGRWLLSNSHPGEYGFKLWGGNLVMTRSVWASDADGSEPPLQGIR